VKPTILFTLAALLAAVPAFAGEDTHTLRVTGTAEVSVAPDICYMNFVVVTEHRKSAKQAYRENNDIMDGLAAAIRARGLESKDVQSRNFTVSPQYHWDDDRDRQIFDGYEVSHTLYVKLRDIDKVSDVLDAAVDAGATQVSSVTFTVENPKKYLSDARVEAIKAARAKAELIAETAGVTLLKPIHINEQEPRSWNRFAAQANVSFDGPDYRGNGEAALEPGEIKLSHTVNITYEIK